MDYAANAVLYWPIENIIGEFEAMCAQKGIATEEELDKVLDGRTEEDYWQLVETNLQAGKVRLVFVADEIPRELLTIVEFLNGQMSPAKVLAVSIPQYVSNDDLTAYVPRLQGQTAQAQLHRSTPGGASRSVRRPLDEAGVLQRIEDCPLPDSEKKAFKQLANVLAKAEGSFFYTDSSLFAWIWNALGSQANTLLACYDHFAFSPDQLQGCVTWRLAYVRAGIDRGDLPGDRAALLKALHEALNDPADSVTEKHPTTNVKGHLDAGQWPNIVAAIEKLVSRETQTES